tara:strand:- start:2935 stop:3858 length:924 start_codon:yes stop_codon:yes gene_type:complete
MRKKVVLKTKIKGIEFRSPIIAASGTFGYGDEAQGFIDLDKIGAIITKSITLEPRKGNPAPRIHEVEFGMINSIGLANVGVHKFCKQKIPLLNSLKTHFIVSVAGSNIEDYLQVIKEIENANGNQIAYEINISCPNTKKGGMEFGVDKDITNSLISQIRDITDKILIVKLSPNVTHIENIAKSAESAGADVISATNTFVGLGIDYLSGKMLLSTKYGGVSGKAIKPLALAKVHKIYNNVNLPIIGMGGISSFKDVIEFFRVGSSMVQVGTLNYRDPSAFTTLYDDLESFLIKNKINNISELKGSYID